MRARYSAHVRCTCRLATGSAPRVHVSLESQPQHWKRMPLCHWSCQKHRSHQLHFGHAPDAAQPQTAGAERLGLHGAGHLCRLPQGTQRRGRPLFQRGTETPCARCAARPPDSAEQAVLSTGARQYAARITKVDQANTHPAMTPIHRRRWAPLGSSAQRGGLSAAMCRQLCTAAGRSRAACAGHAHAGAGERAPCA